MYIRYFLRTGMKCLVMMFSMIISDEAGYVARETENTYRKKQRKDDDGNPNESCRWEGNLFKALIISELFRKRKRWMTLLILL